MNISRFDSTKDSLHDLLRDIGRGRIQLPDFQRGWIWDDTHVQSLIASVSQSFPIGAVMTLENGGTDVRFKARLIEGVNVQYASTEPETLILDGQQRLTALFQSLMSGQGVYTWDTKGQKDLRYYYLDMQKCILTGSDREEAVLSFGADLQLRNFRGEVTLDLSEPENEYANDMFPVPQLFNSADWRQGYYSHWDFNSEKIKLFDKFEREVIKRFEQYDVPVIRLNKETPKEAVCLVFEKVNTQGVTLTVFELLTATFAVSDFHLREDWAKREERLREYPVLDALESVSFLRAITLLTTANSGSAVSCARRDILRLEVQDYEDWADLAEEGFAKAARFLHGQKIFNAKDLPYQSQIVPLAAILAHLDEVGETEGAQQKITQWYWCGVFGEMYGSATDTRLANDFTQVTAWVREDETSGTGVRESQNEPRTIREANFHANRILELRTRNSAAYKGVHALLMREGCLDFRTGESIESQTFFDDNIDIHHIFPKSWCQRQGIRTSVSNSIVNKTALATRTNRKIGGRAPSRYLSTLQQDARIDRNRMDEILTSHRIPVDALRTDAFEEFFNGRKEELLKLIALAMGKRIVRENENAQGISA